MAADTTLNLAPERVAAPLDALSVDKVAIRTGADTWTVGTCTRADPCDDRRDLDSACQGELGIASILWVEDESRWGLHDEDDQFVTLISWCPWCGGRLS